jgi:hypothetical protein
MTAALTRYGMRARSGARVPAVGRMLVILLLCALTGQAQTIAVCCATSHARHEAATDHADQMAGHAADSTGTAQLCGDHLPQDHQCGTVTGTARGTTSAQAHTTSVAAVNYQQSQPQPRHAPRLSNTGHTGTGLADTVLILLRI